MSLDQREHSPEFAFVIATAINRLVDEQVITAAEAEKIKGQNIDELTLRFGNYLQKISQSDDDVNPVKRSKIRTMLGLSLDKDGPEIDVQQRITEIEKFTVEMRDYLLAMQMAFPFVRGFLILGSRMNAGKLPKSRSDADVIVVLENGQITDPTLKTGANLISWLRKYTYHERTKSGIVVNIDDFYTVDELDQALVKDVARIPESNSDRLLWNLNTQALRYIGNPIKYQGQEADEDSADLAIKSVLNSKKGEVARERMLQAKKQKMLYEYSAQILPNKASEDQVTEGPSP